MRAMEYINRLTKEELIELLKKIGETTIVITGAFNSSEESIRDFIIKNHLDKVEEIVVDAADKKIDSILKRD